MSHRQAIARISHPAMQRVRAGTVRPMRPRPLSEHPAAPRYEPRYESGVRRKVARPSTVPPAAATQTRDVATVDDSGPSAAWEVLELVSANLAKDPRRDE